MDKRIIEINGIKMEVDFREATAIERYKVGDRVKVLVKRWNDNYESHAGVIVGFDAFEKLPTIIIAHLEGSEIKYIYLNANSKDIEIVIASTEDLPFTKAQVMDALEGDIRKKHRDLEDAMFKRDNFLKWFGKYFENKGE